MEKILLLGDNAIEQFPIKFLENLENKVINAGIKNINVKKYKKLLPKISKKINNINFIVLQIGFTDLIKFKIDINELILNIREILYKVNSFQIPLIVLPLFPTKDKLVNEIINEFNYRLAQECFECDIEFLDIYDLLLDDNNLLKDCYTDNGIKLNKTGYSLISIQINELINMMKNEYCK